MKPYEILDSGDFKKLERVGKFTIIRPSLNSPYPIADSSLWRQADAEYTRDTGGGKWIFHREMPGEFVLPWERDFRFKIKFTPFGHLGIFPEQEENWKILDEIGKKKKNLKILNLFAYSGVSTVYAAGSGMEVCHVDASRGMVEWARENARYSNLESAKIRWIVDDVQKFLKREIKRNKKYDGVILDPPSFGRGTKGEVWKIETDLIPLLELLKPLLKKEPEFIILSCHTTGYSPLILERVLRNCFPNSGEYAHRELKLREKTGQFCSGGFCSYLYDKSLKDIVQ